MKISPKRSNISTFLSRSSTTENLPRFRCTNEVPPRYKTFVVQQSQTVLRDYLHATKSLPFAFSDLIAKNSPFSLSGLVSNIRFSAPNFAKRLRTFLRYDPINEYEFFYESIGIAYCNVWKYLPRNKFFLSDDCTVLNSAFVLAKFGFPWNTLGKLYEEEPSIFLRSEKDLDILLTSYSIYLGFSKLSVVGICLAFPRFLALDGERDLGGDAQAIFDDLKVIFVGFDAEKSCFEGNVDAWYELCCKARVFHDLGCENGKIGELMCAKKDIFLRCRREDLVRKVEYFMKFGSSRVDIGNLLLHSPEILELDLETPVMSVFRVLKHFGLDEDRLGLVIQKFSHVLGRNEMTNLPSVMRALDLSEWFFDRVKSTGSELLETCAVTFPEEDSDKEFSAAMNRIRSSRCPGPSTRKVDFLKEVGFGENALTIKALRYVKGTREQLLERFECFLEMGIEYSRLCLLIRLAPQILTQSSENVRTKVKFLQEEMGLSTDYLESFPAFVCYDLDRIKYRYGFYVWLREFRFLERDYGLATVIGTSESHFVARLSRVHPAAPKQYLERFARRKFDDCS